MDTKSIEKILKEQIHLREGDLVIHINHGLGRFRGLQTTGSEGVINDFLKLEYADNSFLFVPIENFDFVTRYGEYTPGIKLDSLSSRKWGEKKAKVREHLKIIADELIAIAAKRHLSRMDKIFPNEGEYQEFCNRFSFRETVDQLRAIADIEGDLARGIPMDRLICGDVGFGKTEVAMRAAFLVANDRHIKRQVAVITPTTLLCRQHYAVFRKRFAHTGMKIATMSRMQSTGEISETKKGLESGDIDIVIGTHALLSSTLKFKNLSMVIIDEEQRFGVKQKEKLKEMSSQLHMLSMSATPIPRTLQMSMTGIRDISIIGTPPVNRLLVNTTVGEYSDAIINTAIGREIGRNGQAFLVVPRIADIDEVEFHLRKHLPDVTYGVAHGSMRMSVLDGVMNDFYDGKFTVLVATTIVESGLDVPNANTMIIYKANMFGLAQLYQLRGRVGRGETRAYAYLTYKASSHLTENAVKRLETIGSIDSLAASFLIASNDTEIRGSGNLVGEEQSGHIREVGAELYNYLLRDAIRKARLRKKMTDDFPEDDDFPIQIKLGLSTIIPAFYLEDLDTRIRFYRNIADIETPQQKTEIEEELRLFYGEIPPEVQNLLATSMLKIKCRELGIEKMERLGDSISIMFRKNLFSNPDGLMALAAKEPHRYKIKGGKYFQYTMVGDNVLAEAETLLEVIGKIAEDYP